MSTQTIEIRLSTNIVTRVFRRVAGVSYTAPAGHTLVDVPATTYVSPGFVATQTETGWTFAPPPLNEEPLPPATVQEELALAKAAVAEAQTRLEAVEARIG